MFKELYVIYGGPSSEREVSFSSKDYFYDLYKEFNTFLVEWLTNFNFVFNGTEYAEEEFYSYLSKKNCIVIISGHGEYIEDGYLQEKLALHKIKYTGSSSSSCKLAMNKYESQLVAKEFVKVIPTYKTLVKEFNWDLFNKYIQTFPVFIKPNSKGSSVGCFLANSKEDLIEILKTINENEEYLIQEQILGIEVSVGSVRNIAGFLKIPPTEIVPKISNFFDYKAKYQDGGSEEITPARFSDEINSKVSKLANNIHNALGLGYYSRSDFIITPDKDIYYLETNSLPGMSKNSILPKELKVSNNVEIFKFGLTRQLPKFIKKEKVVLDIIYQSQFTDIVNNSVARNNGWVVPDFGYEKSGAISLADYKKYSHNLCGSACMKMILDFYNKDTENLFSIFYELNNLGLYTSDISLNYSDLHPFLKKYCLDFKTYRVDLTIDEICLNIQNKIPVVISIKTPNLSNKTYYQNSGHLVLVTGYDLNKKLFYINNPSGDSQNKSMNFDDYCRVCFQRGFIIY